MKAKPLPISDLIESLNYDHETGLIHWKEFATGRKIHKQAGWVGAHGYLLVSLNYDSYLAHRVAWALYYKEDPGNKYVDHINGIPSDNRISNLRLVTLSQNAMNSKARKKKSKLPKGVYFDQRQKRYRARIYVNGKEYKRTYKELEHAIAARCLAEYQLFGQYSVRNRNDFTDQSRATSP
jgi:HNH endonuclease